MKKPIISVIIPVEGKTDYLKEALYRYSKQTYPNFEVIIASSKFFSASYSFARMVVDKKLSRDVASKRNEILEFGKGEIFVFNDDDVFVPKDYLRKIMQKFKNQEILAACGPLLTPESDTFLQKASGAVWESYLGSLGAGVYRSRKMPAQMVYDYPAANLILRREVFKAVGGFEPRLYPGEDTKLCLLIFNKYRQGIVYDPDLLVYHHRKPLFEEHLRQIGRYGNQRGWFALSYPTTSFKLAYFLPSFLLLYFVFWIFLLIKNFLFGASSLFFLLSFPLIVYFFLVLSESMIISYRKSLKLVPFVAFGILTTHLYYGWRFLKSFTGKILKKIEELLRPFLGQKL